MEDDTDHLVFVVELLLRWVLVVLYSFYVSFSDMRGKSLIKHSGNRDEHLWLGNRY